MASVVKVFVDAVDGLLLFFAEGLISLGLLQLNAGDVFVLFVWGGDEKRVQAFFQVLAFDEMEALVFDLFQAQRQGWVEMPQQARLGGLRYLPNAEEAQDMVDAVSIEIAGHHL